MENRERTERQDINFKINSYQTVILVKNGWFQQSGSATSSGEHSVYGIVYGPGSVGREMGPPSRPIALSKSLCLPMPDRTIRNIWNLTRVLSINHSGKRNIWPIYMVLIPIQRI